MQVSIWNIQEHAKKIVWLDISDQERVVGKQVREVGGTLYAIVSALAFTMKWEAILRSSDFYFKRQTLSVF